MPLRIENLQIITAGRRPPVKLPQSVLDALIPAKEPSALSNHSRQVAVALREALAKSGISRRDLPSRLNWSNNPSKTLRLVDAAIEGSVVDPVFIRNFIEVLGCSDEQIGRIMKDEEAHRKQRAEATHHRLLHSAYRRFGPHLYAMARDDYQPSLMSVTGDAHFHVSIPFELQGNEIRPPEVEEVGEFIRNAPDDFKLKKPAVFGAFLYHRLPEDLAFLDMEGNLISRGDCSLEYPQGVKRFFGS